MSRVLKVSNSDYRIKVKDSGSITLDTGLSLGTVYVTGDLVVKGNTTTINTSQTTIAVSYTHLTLPTIYSV